MLTTPKVEPTTGQSIVDFQLRLLDAIADVEAAYRSIKHEEKFLIANKARYQLRWFGQRMAKLAGYTMVIDHVLAVGRAIGDGFAWFFYERDRDLIAEHLKHQRQRLLPPGDGALGERMTLKNMQGFGGRILIYHGTTTFLRMGDISFIDTSTMRVACVGELKTQRTAPDLIEVSIALIAGSADQLPKASDFEVARKPRERPAPEFPPAMRDRFARQRKTMGEAMARVHEKSVDDSLGGPSKFHFEELQEVVSRSRKRSFEYVHAGPGVVIGALRLSQNGNLGSNFLGQFKHAERAAAEVPQWAVKTVDPASKWNSLSLGSVGSGSGDLAFGPETIPFAWWPVDRETLKEILFGDVMVITLFNPAHMLRSLEERGFELTFDRRHRLKEAVRTHGDKQLGLDHFEYYYRLVQGSLLSEAGVMSIIDQTIEMATTRFDQAPVRIEIVPKVTRQSLPFRDRGGRKALPS